MTPPSGVTVGHVLRAYLEVTETFVHNQIVSLGRYRPVVVAHHRRPVTHFTFEEGVIADERLAPPLARVERLAYRAGRVALPPGVALLARYLRAQDARLLHYHYLTDARFLLGLKRRTNLPAIVSGYGYDVSWFPRRWHGLGKRYIHPIFDRLDLFLAMSDDMRADLVRLGCPEHKVHVHYYGTDTRRFRSEERRYAHDGPVTVLCCARLERNKGQQDVLAALRRVERRGRDDFRVVIVGQGPMRGELERLVGEYGWQSRVSFTGHVPYTSPALVAHYRAAEVFAHPSLTIAGNKEGIPGTIVEAMASGLPVVATYHAGIPAVITSGSDGLLVRENDHEALAAALDELIRNPAERERLGRAAAVRAADELDLVARTLALEQIYDRFA